MHQIPRPKTCLLNNCIHLKFKFKSLLVYTQKKYKLYNSNSYTHTNPFWSQDHLGKIQKVENFRSKANMLINITKYFWNISKIKHTVQPRLIKFILQIAWVYKEKLVYAERSSKVFLFFYWQIFKNTDTTFQRS